MTDVLVTTEGWEDSSSVKFLVGAGVGSAVRQPISAAAFDAVQRVDKNCFCSVVRSVSRN